MSEQFTPGNRPPSGYGPTSSPAENGSPPPQPPPNYGPVPPAPGYGSAGRPPAPGSPPPTVGSQARFGPYQAPPDGLVRPGLDGPSYPAGPTFNLRTVRPTPGAALPGGVSKPVPNYRRLIFILGGLIALLLVTIIVMLVLVLRASGPGLVSANLPPAVPTTAPSQTTSAAQITSVASTTAPMLPAITIEAGSQRLSGPGASTTAPVLPATTAATFTLSSTTAAEVTASPSPVPTPSLAVSLTPSQDEQNLTLGKTEYDNKRWAEAASLFEKLGPDSPQAKESRPLLTNCYVEQAKAAFGQDDKLKSAETARDFYRKAASLDPANSDLAATLQKLELYTKGRAQYDNAQCNLAVTPLGELYNGNKGQTKYRDTAEIYYNCLVVLGDEAGKRGQWAEAKGRYEDALKVDVSDKGLAQQGLARAKAVLEPTPTATPRPPAPTATPPPPAPPPPCSRGGSGSNFFAYQSNGTGLGNAPDQGRSNITGTIVDRNNNRLVGVTVVARSGGFSYTAVTNGNGSYQFGANLGRGVWTIQVIAAPGRTLCTSVASSVQMNGQAGAVGTVSFTESTP